jgi:cation-transporting P-type ATPase C
VNTLGLLAATFGTLNPVLAAVLHNASSVAVNLNSSRLIRHDPRRAGDDQRRRPSTDP